MPFNFPQPASRNGVQNNISASTSTSTASAAFGSQTYQIRIAAASDCFYKVGDGTPTAAATDVYLPGKWVEFVKVTPGQKVAVFSATAQTVSVTEETL